MKEPIKTLKACNIGIITIVDSLSVTSMPVNEFVLFRYNKKYECKQGLIVYGEPKESDVFITDDIPCIFVGKSVSRMKNAIHTLLKYTGEKTVFHVHQPKSARLFYRSAIPMFILSKTVFTVHSTYSMRSNLYKLESWISVLFPKKVTCVSETAYKEFSPFLKKVKGKNIFAIQNGVDYAHVRSVVTEIGGHRDIKSLVCVARMIPLKNHKFLIELLKELPGFTLKLIGKEDEHQEIRNYAEITGVLDRVKFLGVLERKHVFQELNKSGIYVSSSLAEGMPISVLEAMCLGLIPVLSSISPHVEISKTCNEVIVKDLKVEEWKNAILQIISKNNYEKVSKELMEQVQENFSLDRMHMRYFELYKEMIGGDYA